MDGDGRLSERDGTVAGWENGERSPSYRAGESRVLHIQLSYSGSHTTHLMATTQLHDGDMITRDGRTVARWRRASETSRPYRAGESRVFHSPSSTHLIQWQRPSSTTARSREMGERSRASEIGTVVSERDWDGCEPPRLGRLRATKIVTVASEIGRRPRASGKVGRGMVWCVSLRIRTSGSCSALLKHLFSSSIQQDRKHTGERDGRRDVG
jgi:hypothetical protein